MQCREGREEWERGISTLSLNSLSVCVWELSLPLESPLSSDRRMTETSWELQHSPSLSLSPSVSLSLFPTRTDRSQIHSNRAYFNTFSVGTWGWLKINNLSIASRSLSFSQYLSFWVCFAVVAAVVVLHCSGGFSSFFLPSFSSFPLFSGEEGMLFWVQSVIRHGAALSVSLYKQLWCLFLLSGFYG